MVDPVRTARRCPLGSRLPSTWDVADAQCGDLNTTRLVCAQRLTLARERPRSAGPWTELLPSPTSRLLLFRCLDRRHSGSEAVPTSGTIITPLSR